LGASFHLKVWQWKPLPAVGLTPRRRAALAARLDGIIKPSEDHVLIIEVGPADAVDPRVESLGRPFETIKREAVVV
jgi:CRISPR-associated protein Cas2